MGDQFDVGLKPTLFVLIVALLILLLYIYGQLNYAFLYLLSNGLPPLMAFAASAIAVLALTRTGVSKEDRWSLVWLGFAAGMILWFMGEFTWAIYSLLLGVPVPYPSIADIFWLAGYIPFMWALILQIWPFREGLSSRKLILVILLTLILGTIVLLILVPVSIIDEQDALTIAVSLAYPLLDVLLLLIAVPSFVFFARGILWRPMLLVIIGIIFTLLADISFSLAIFEGVYYNGHPLELFFHWSYLAFAFGFYLQLKRGKTSD